jgi:hypothetical protein
MLTAAVYGFFAICAYCVFWLVVGVYEVVTGIFRAIFNGRGGRGNANMIG